MTAEQISKKNNTIQDKQKKAFSLKGNRLRLRLMQKLCFSKVTINFFKTKCH